MEPADYLSKLKQQIEKGAVKEYGTFVLIILMMVFFINLGLDNPIGHAIEPEKTCEEIKGVCSENACVEGFTEKENYCPNNKYCCKKTEQ